MYNIDIVQQAILWPGWISHIIRDARMAWRAPEIKNNFFFKIQTMSDGKEREMVLISQPDIPLGP